MYTIRDISVCSPRKRILRKKIFIINDILNAFEKGDENFIDSVFERVLKQATHEGEINIARKLLQRGLSPQEVEGYTDIPKEDLEEITKQLQKQ